MSDTKDTGGPAFPVVAEGGHGSGLHPEIEHGMTLRDYFAAKAPGEEVHSIVVAEGWNKFLGHLYLEAVTKARYIYADAMLKAREQ